MPINIERPRSALLRGVHITEFKGHVINPDPIILQETDLLLEEFLSPTKLKALTGVNDLKKVEYLEMIVDTSETSLGNFGIYLPSLKQLKLNGSHVPRMRDLGTSLVYLRVLWLSRSGLSDLDGIAALNNLRELYLAYNEISDISSCSMLENLECLDLEGNLIEDVKQIEFLNLCTRLTNLTLYGNPICAKASPDDPDDDSTAYSYRHEIIKILPDLQILDDELTLNTQPLSPRKELKTSGGKEPGKKSVQISETTQQQCPFDDDWQLINQILDEGIGPPEENLAINESIRPGMSSGHGDRPTTSVRPLSALRPLSSYRIRTSMQDRPRSRGIHTSNSSSGLNTASSRVSTGSARPSTDPISEIGNDASHLTVGPTLQGNPLKALMARRKNRDSTNASNNDTDTSASGHVGMSKKPPAAYKQVIASIEQSKTKNDASVQLENKELRDEINNWRKEHVKKLEERKQYFEPQVLKIEDIVNEEPLSDENDEENNYLDAYASASRVSSASTYQPPQLHPSYTRQQPNDQVAVANTRQDTNSLTRPKTAFKQSFDYDEATEVVAAIDIKKEKAALSPSPTTQPVPAVVLARPDSADVIVPSSSSEHRKKDKSEKSEKSEKSGEKKKRSKSKDRHHHHHRSGSRRSPSPAGSRDSASANMSRGDTGYSSSSSSLASLRLKSLDGYHLHPNQRQPIIVSSNSNSLSSSNSNLHAQGGGGSSVVMHTHNIKPLTPGSGNTTAANNPTFSSHSSSGLFNSSFSGTSPSATLMNSSLSKLKSNLGGPLSGPIKLPSNNK